MSAFSDLLQRSFAPYGELSDAQVALLENHYHLLLKWNQKINLTRLTSLEDAVTLHYCESLYVARFLPATPLRIADIGSGAGFPGISLAAMRPDCQFDLIESDQRKAVFLREAGRGLPNIKVIAKRAAEAEGGYDYGVARAVIIDDVVSSGLAPRYLFLGSEGEKLPWGENRRLHIIDAPRST